MVHYLNELTILRREVVDHEVMLRMILNAIFGLAGQDPPKMGGLEEDETIPEDGLPTVKMTARQIDEWAKAGYPAMDDWIRMRAIRIMEPR